MDASASLFAFELNVDTEWWLQRALMAFTANMLCQALYYSSTLRAVSALWSTVPSLKQLLVLTFLLGVASFAYYSYQGWVQVDALRAVVYVTWKQVERAVFATPETTLFASPHPATTIPVSDSWLTSLLWPSSHKEL